MKDRDVRFHEQWLGLVQPIEGLVFSIPVLADAQITPEVAAELSTTFAAHLTGPPDGPRLRNLGTFFREFLGYDQPGMLVPSEQLPRELSFYAAEGGQEIRPTFALARGPFQPATDDPFAAFAPPAASSSDAPAAAADKEDAADSRYWALVWDLTEVTPGLDLDAPDAVTGPWRYPPTAKLERLLRHVHVPVGFIFNGHELRLVYAPGGETTAHLTFRMNELQQRDGRPVLAALELLLHARRAYTAAPAHTLPGLLAESRRRQADVTSRLASQVFEAVETLVAGFQTAAARDATGSRLDWLRPAMEAGDDHFYQGVLSVVLRLVFLLYAEDKGLLPVEHPSYARHLSLLSMYSRLAQDAGIHPESMHHRFGAYGQLLALFRAIFFGVKHGDLQLPPRRGRLFDPNTYPFLEGGQPDWTAAVASPAARAAVQPPSLDDGTIHRVLHRLMVFEGQRLSYRTLDVEQIGSVYESLMGYHVIRMEEPAARVGKHGVWVEIGAVRRMSAADRARQLKEICGVNPGPIKTFETALKEAGEDREAALEALSALSPGRRSDVLRHRAAPGQLVLQPGEERRRTGTHYTPRSLTEKVVRRTLEPLLACLGEGRSANRILQLKICDPAMGSGAFLVAACRQLADEIVKSWTRDGHLAGMIEQHGDAHLHARRLVAQRCLYGVDKNAAAVELAKLSLWLVTLNRDLPFTFVDHTLRHGDSLVGLDFQQIRAFHWKPSKQVGLCDRVLKEALEQALAFRQQLQALAESEDPYAQAEKRRLLEFARQALERVRLIADVCVGAFFAKDKDAAREKERLRRLGLVETWLGGDETVRGELDELAGEIRRALPPFHWWIELPEVFFEERPDPLEDGRVNGAALMEAVVSNPPFGGKNTIVDAHPDGYLDWLKVAHEGAHGNSDHSAHFFRRAGALIGQNGSFGLIATNTIAQGDTRSTGLQRLVADGWSLYDATDSMPWPGGAAVTVSVVHAARGSAAGRTQPQLDGKPVAVLNSRLRPKPERPDPAALGANANLSFQGSIVLGMGFTLKPHERESFIARNPKNAERIFPYLGGEEVNTSPTQGFDRYVICFGQMSLPEAERWPDLLDWVRENVKPERDQLKNNTDGLQRKKYWWQFGRYTPALFQAIGPLPRCLVTARTSKFTMFSFQPTDRIFSENLVVFATPTFTAFSVLQSRLHVMWVRQTSSTLKTDQAYRPTDCFGTFPFPHADPRSRVPDLEDRGQRLYEARAAHMQATGAGLTDTYNAVMDAGCLEPSIVELRELHEELDREVLATYGWDDLTVPRYCPVTEAERHAYRSFEDEVIDRLYLLNIERAREEQRLGAADVRPAGRRKKAAAR